MRIRRWSPPSMFGSRRRSPRPNSCSSFSGPKAANTSSRSDFESLSSVSSSWLRTKLAHWQSEGIVGSSASACSQRRRGLAREREVERLVDGEREQHLQLVAVLVAEERPLVVGRQVDLAEQDRLAAAAADEAPQVAQQLVRVDHRAARHPHRLEHERHGVDAEAAEPLLEPEADDLRDLVAHGRVGHVEVGLVGVEAVQVVLARRLVPRPVRGLLVGEDEVAGLLRRLLVLPTRRSRGTASPCRRARPGTTGAGRRCGS